MGRQLFNTGEEYIVDELDGKTFDVGLYNDAVDQLADSDDVGQITTEPAGSDYTRETAQITTEKNANGNWTIQVADVSFDTSDSGGNVDSGFVVVDFDSDDAGDAGTVNTHLLFSFPIEDANGNETTLDLDNFGTVTLTGQSLSLN